MKKMTSANIFLAEARARVGLKQREFANLLDTSVDTISQYETGRRQPTLRVIARVEQILIELGLETAACTPAEIELLTLYRGVSPVARAEVLTVFRNLVASHKAMCGLY